MPVINWGEILTKAVTTLITGIVIGAAVIVYQGATTAEGKIQAAKETLQSQNLVITQLVDAIDRKLKQYQEEDQLKFAQLEKTLKEVMRANQLGNVDGLSKISGFGAAKAAEAPASESISQQIPEYSNLGGAME